MSDKLTAEIKQFAKEVGADAVGIGSLDRFEGCPKEMDPRYLYPDAKSIIGFIFRIPRGYIRGIEEGTHFYQYPSLGYAGINEVAAPAVLYETGRFLEDRGYEAAVHRNTGGRGSVSDMTGRLGAEESPELHGRAIQYTVGVSPELPPPDVFIHFRIAAFICGLGEIGYSKMFLTPQFGPMNRQAFIFTDAPLEPDPLYDGPPLCNQCMACVASCPGKCLSLKEKVQVNIAGRDMEWGKLDEWKCFASYIGVNKASNPFLDRHAFDEHPEGDKLIKGEKEIFPDEYGWINKKINECYPAASGYNPPKCGGCLRACISSLERRGILTNKFKNRFRTEKPWKMTIGDKNVNQ